jgi:hypothetical protein
VQREPTWRATVASRGRARLVANGSWPSLGTVFFFFSNRLGCLGSLVVSVIFTVVLIAIFTR